MTKTEQIIEIVKKKSKQIEYGEWEIKLVIFDGEIIGLDQLKEPIIKVRLGKD